MLYFQWEGQAVVCQISGSQITLVSAWSWLKPWKTGQHPLRGLILLVLGRWNPSWPRSIPFPKKAFSLWPYWAVILWDIFHFLLKPVADRSEWVFWEGAGWFTDRLSCKNSLLNHVLKRLLDRKIGKKGTSVQVYVYCPICISYLGEENLSLTWPPDGGIAKILINWQIHHISESSVCKNRLPLSFIPHFYKHCTQMKYLIN